MRQHILLPTDFSDNAWEAALYAIELYADTSCTFYFSHAWTFVNTGARTYIAPNYIDALKDASNKHLSEFMERAKAKSKNENHRFETIFSVDSLTDSIKKAITKYKIDFIIMGTKGATGAKEFFLGSNAVTVINRVRTCPLILVPDRYEYATPRRIVFPTDFKENFGKEIDNLKKIAELHHPTIEVLYINAEEALTGEQHKHMESLKEHLKDYATNYHWLPEKGKKEHIITDFIKESSIKFLAMVHYERSFIEDLIREPLVKNIGYHTHIPFLVIPQMS